ncbi:MAG: hypothetical protein H6732_04030 [Alphaproteobacteria bacterium]|nr:hypothetical protein [Alphaproteobacteria bacterium]
MRSLTLPVLATIVLATGCGSSGTQHCARDGSDGNTEICYDFSGIEQSLFGLGLQASLGILCQITGAPPSDGTCPDEGKVGGCSGDEQEKYDYIEWTYTGTIDELTCGSDEEKVGPDGAPYTGEDDTDAADTDTDA